MGDQKPQVFMMSSGVIAGDVYLMGSLLRDWLPKAKEAVRREIVPTEQEREENHQKHLNALARRVETTQLKAQIARAENDFLKEKKKNAELLPKRPVREFNPIMGAFEPVAFDKKGKRKGGTGGSFFGL